MNAYGQCRVERRASVRSIHQSIDPSAKALTTDLDVALPEALEAARPRVLRVRGAAPRRGRVHLSHDCCVLLVGLGGGDGDT